MDFLLWLGLKEKFAERVRHERDAMLMDGRKVGDILYSRFPTYVGLKAHRYILNEAKGGEILTHVWRGAAITPLERDKHDLGYRYERAALAEQVSDILSKMDEEFLSGELLSDEGVVRLDS